MTPETIAYTKRDNGDRFGDLYRPDASKPAPVIIAVHGGGWRRGHRGDLSHWALHLANSGFAVFAIDYTKSEHGPSYPANVEDVRDAFRFVGAEGVRLGVDARRLGGIGASAGAHLLSLAALTTDDISINVLTLVYGVYDVEQNWRADRALNRPRDEDPTERMMGGSPDDKTALYQRASPLSHAANARGKQALMIWGDSDDMVQPAQSERFAQALTDAGADVQTHIVKGAGHFWFSKERLDDPQSHAREIAPEVVRFFRQNLAAA